MTRPAQDPALDAISELVLQCLDRMEREGSGAVDELCREHPEHADALRSRLSHLLDAGWVDTDAELEVPERLGDFRLGACLGGGGMGLVYAATQESLGRQVALKLIRPEQLFFPESRERFRREVAAVARLAHPGIVPVYTVGEEAGLPFFAMELVEGATLAQLLSEIAMTHGDDPSTLNGAHLTDALGAAWRRRSRTIGETLPDDAVTARLEAGWVDACLAIATQVARALEHAHARGVLHRDLKPSNVMLTLDGRALLFDFGLASTAGVTRITRTGSQVGSLPYMAPEQIRGADIDERTDVYGLGALLCELLTFAPPQGARGGEALMAAILVGEPTDLRERNPALSRDAETVVLRALEHEPSRRYASVSAFAADLENVRARRPIDARRAGPLLRAVRWGQRHPARAMAGALALALAVGIPTSIAIERGAANETIRLALEDTEEEWLRAEANLDQALVALDTFLHETGRAFLGDIPGMEEARLRLLEQAETLLQELMPQQPGDVVMLERWGAIQRSKADALERLGRLPESVEAYRAQLAVLERLRAGAPTQGEFVRAEVGCLNNLGNALARQGADAESVAVLHRARALLLAEAEPSRDLRELAVVERNLALAHATMQRDAEAHAAYEASIATADALLQRAQAGDDQDEELAAYRAQAAAVAAHALFFRERGDPGKAWSLYALALPVLMKLAETSPELPLLVDEVATCAMNAGATLSDLGEDADAEELLRYGLGLAERLTRDFPHSPRYVRTLTGTSTNLAFVLQRGDGAREEVAALLTRAVDLSQAVLDRFPDELTVREAHVVACVNLASHHVGQHQRTRAIAPAAAGVVSADLMRQRRPDDPTMRWCAAWLRIEEAYGRAAAGEQATAEALATRALEILPDDPRAHVAAAEVLVTGLGALEGEAYEAQAERALRHLERGVALGYANVEKLESTGELGPLRERPGFPGLVAQARALARP